MNHIARMDNSKRMELFQVTALEMGLQPMVIEKDFWVCFMLNHLFHESAYMNAWVFKGGTSLSKSYHLIERFSEDIDLILDWRNVIKEDENPWDERSKTKQDAYNKRLNNEAAAFYTQHLVPTLNNELSDILGDGRWCSVDEYDNMVVNFYYPQLFETKYLRPSVRLEIGPLAEWIPSHKTEITPFAAEKYPSMFELRSTMILTVDAEKTFWEKATILHKIAHFPDGKRLPPRYARHLYDVYCMGNSALKEKAFARKELLERDVAFKQKFYYSKSAHYETATLKDIVLLPPKKMHDVLKADYIAMGNMIYGEMPDFEELLRYLAVLQEEIHKLI